VEVPDDDAALDAWIADIEAYLQKLGPLSELQWSELWPYASSVQGAVVALQHARLRRPPAVRFQLIIGLAQATLALVEAQRKEALGWGWALRQEIDENNREMDRVFAEIERADKPRLAALAKAREEKKKGEAERREKIEALRPDFEARRRRGMSASCAARILGERHGLSWETIRRQLRRPPRK
jgi:hypothetical protein